MMSGSKPFFLFFCFFLICSFSFAGQDPGHYIQKTNGCMINWSTGEINISAYAEFPAIVNDPNDFDYRAGDYAQPRNEAQARLLAKDEAVRSALKKADRLFRGLNLNGEETLGEAMKTPGVNRRISGFIRSAWKMDDLQYDVRGVSVFIQYNIFGEKGLLSLNDDAEEDSFLIFNREDFLDLGMKSRGAYEGLVISAPYLKLTPALAPKIYSENGNLIYDPSFLNASAAKKTGTVIYAKAPYGLVKKVNLQFFHCIAVNTTRFMGSDIVIRDEDAAILLSDPATVENLKSCKVVILASDR